GPRIAKPDRRQQREPRRLRTAIGRADPYADILRPVLGVLDKYIEVAVAFEYAGVEQLDLRLASRAPPALNQLIVREGRLRILVQTLHVRMRRSRIEVEVVFLYIFAMIPFIAAESEQALLEYGIAAV